VWCWCIPPQEGPKAALCPGTGFPEVPLGTPGGKVLAGKHWELYCCSLAFLDQHLSFSRT